MEDITLILLSVRDTVKLYHWATDKYSAHKATDKFLKQFDKHVDSFVEVLQGSRSEFLNIENSKVTLKTMSDKEIIEYLKTYRNWLSEDLPVLLFDNETDLLNLKDEMIEDVNQLLYLLRFK